MCSCALFASLHVYGWTNSSNHAIFTADVTSMALCVFLLFTQTDSNKFFSASRDFLGGLPAIFFAAYSRLSLDFRGGGGLAKFSRLAAG